MSVNENEVVHDIKDIINIYKEDDIFSMYEISFKYDLSKDEIIKILKANNIATKYVVNLKTDKSNKIEKMIALYKEGNSMCKIAKILNVNQSTVSKNLAKLKGKI